MTTTSEPDPTKPTHPNHDRFASTGTRVNEHHSSLLHLAHPRGCVCVCVFVQRVASTVSRVLASSDDESNDDDDDDDDRNHKHRRSSAAAREQQQQQPEPSGRRDRNNVPRGGRDSRWGGGGGWQDRDGRRGPMPRGPVRG